MSLRKLQHHEAKLLKKVDFLRWKTDNNEREVAILRRYHIEKREDYVKYNQMVGQIHSLVFKLVALDPADPFRIKTTDMLLQKLYQMGIIATEKNLALAKAVTASSFCRRRLSVMMVRMKMSESVKESVTLIEHGHVRVGPNVITDPAFLVIRSLEDHVTWVDNSKIKRTIQKYNDKLDDFVLLGN